MTNTNVSVAPTRPAEPSLRRYLSCVRVQDVVVLQGSPLLGAAFALGHPRMQDLAPMAILLLANVLLVTHIFLLNDWSNLATDLADPNKAAGVFTARGVGRRAMGGLALALVVSSLVLFALLGPAILGLASGIAALSALYSLPRFDWKGRPLLSSFAHLAGGMLHFLLGYSLARAIDPRGLAIAAFFALVFAAGHLTQEIRDHQGDAANAVSTNSVTFGQRRTFAASLVLFTVAHILLFAMALAGLIPRPIAALVALYPVQLYWSRQALVGGLTHESVSTLQKRYRVLYSVIGLAMVAALLAAAARIPG